MVTKKFFVSLFSTTAETVAISSAMNALQGKPQSHQPKNLFVCVMAVSKNWKILNEEGNPNWKETQVFFRNESQKKGKKC